MGREQPSLFERGLRLLGGNVPIVGQNPTPLGTIAILSSEHGRYTRFWLSQLGLKPPGPTKLVTKFSVNIAEARNEALADAEGEWLWFIDDDHTFAPDLLTKLIARDVDVIQPLVLARYAPFGPVIMGPETQDGSKHWRLALLPSDKGGIKEVHVAGAAGMLIRRRVWERIPRPWFTAGDLNPEVLGEDVGFCRRVRAAGFKVYCDLDNRMGHLNVGEVWPVWDEEHQRWETEITFGQGAMRVPAAQPKYYVKPETGEAFKADGTKYEGDL